MSNIKISPIIGTTEPFRVIGKKILIKNGDQYESLFDSNMTTLSDLLLGHSRLLNKGILNEWFDLIQLDSAYHTNILPDLNIIQTTSRITPDSVDGYKKFGIKIKSTNGENQSEIGIEPSNDQLSDCTDYITGINMDEIIGTNSSAINYYATRLSQGVKPMLELLGKGYISDYVSFENNVVPSEVRGDAIVLSREIMVFDTEDMLFSFNLIPDETIVQCVNLNNQFYLYKGNGNGTISSVVVENHSKGLKDWIPTSKPDWWDEHEERQLIVDDLVGFYNSDDEPDEDKRTLYTPNNFIYVNQRYPTAFTRKVNSGDLVEVTIEWSKDNIVNQDSVFILVKDNITDDGEVEPYFMALSNLFLLEISTDNIIIYPLASSGVNDYRVISCKLVQENDS